MLFAKDGPRTIPARCRARANSDYGAARQESNRRCSGTAFPKVRFSRPAEEPRREIDSRDIQRDLLEFGTCTIPNL